MEHSSAPSSDRRLSAIMFTDIVGYSALTQRDESLALRLLSEHNALLRPVFADHRGTEIKTIGDAFLVEFSSALDAVQCAIAIQRSIKERNEGCNSAERFEVRIGVHLGDVIHEDGDVFGDGVNIASRIYPVATPGGICISGSVSQQVHNKIDLPLIKLPVHALKNISLPIDLFEITLPWRTGIQVSPLLSRQMLVRGRMILFAAAAIFLGYWIFTTYITRDPYPMNRVAVLPFKSIAATQEQDYFAEGMTEELISSLSRISGLEVIARSSVMQYQQASLDFALIGDKLKAGAIVEGSIRPLGDSVRVTVRLIETSSERLLWNEEYNQSAANALKTQDEIAVNVATALKIQLLETERHDLTTRGSHDPDAVRLYLLGRYYLNKRTSDDVVKSVDYFTRSRDIDSLFAPAYVGLAEGYTLIAGAGYGSLPREKALNEAIAASDKAMAIDPRFAEAYSVRGYILFRLLWNWKDADSLFRKAIQLKPSYARGHEWYALYLSLKGRTREGLDEMRKASSLDPQSPSVATGLGRMLAFDRQYQESITYLTQVVRDHPSYAQAYFALALSYAYDKQYDKAFPMFEKAIQLSGRFHVILSDYAYYLAKVGRTTEARAVLAELDSVSAYQPGTKQFRGLIRIALGDEEKGYGLLEEALNENDGLLAYLRSDPFVDELREQPRFKNIISKVWEHE